MTVTEFLIPKARLFFSLSLLVLVVWMCGTGTGLARQLPEGFLPDTVLTATHPVYEIYKNRYQPDSSAIAALSDIRLPVDIIVFFGEWCHDSKREIPRFLKVMELTDNPLIRVRYHHIARKDYKIGAVYTDWNFQYTPTILLFRDKKEIGRIAEKPVISIESDLLTILTDADGKRSE